MVVNNFQELHTALEQYKNNSFWIFRGHGDPSWELKPKIGRDPFSKVNEEAIFNAWKRRASEFIKENLSSDWEWLAIAQHHGLATRLLDWSYNPLVAAFFAVSSGNKDLDAKIYCYKCHYELLPKNNKNPFTINNSGKFRPNGVASRIVRQGGLFTISSDPNDSLKNQLKDEEEIREIIISAKYKKQLKEDLNYYGINDSSVFPDLDGLSTHINWIIENNIYNLHQKEI